MGGNGGTFHQKYLWLQVNELEKKLDLMLKEQVSAYLSMHKNVGENRDCQGKFKARNERGDKKILQSAVREYDPNKKRLIKPINFLAGSSSFPIKLEQNILINVVTDVQKSLCGKSFIADCNTSIFSKSTQTTLKDLVAYAIIQSNFNNHSV